MAWRCNMCLVFVALSLKLLLNHIYSQHSHDPGFNILCGIDGCPRSFTKYNTFWRHVHKDHPYGTGTDRGTNVNNVTENHHSSYPTENETTTGDNIDNIVNNDEYENEPMESTDKDDVKKKMIAYTLNLREHHRVRETTTNFIVEQTEKIIQQNAQQLQRKVQEELQCIGGVSAVDMAKIDQIFEESELNFAGLDSTYGRRNYIRSTFSVIDPEVITVGRDTKIHRKGGQRRLKIVNITFTYVPLVESILQFLEHTNVSNLVFDSNHFHSEGFYSDLFNGSVFRNHDIFRDTRDSLGIFLYFDDLEICNPLGKRSGTHKICAFYYSIVNLPPTCRSRLPAVRLLALMKRKNMTQSGINKILERIKIDLETLAEGISINIRGEQKIVKGAVLGFVGDTLASHEFCGFKMGVGFSNQKCRECYCTNDLMQKHFHQRHFNLRLLNQYDNECQQIEAAQTKAYRSRLSTVYGINFRSIARDFIGFNLLTMVPEDAMHVIFEGVALYEVKNCLSVLVEDGHFSLKKLNIILEHFSYGYKDLECQPSVIPESVFQKEDTSLHQSASSMMVLLKLLPFFLIDKLNCDKNNYILLFFIELCEIVKLLMAPVIAVETLSLLSSMIESHLKKFKELFPLKNIIPKQHYLVHLPSTIERYGPLHNVWSMRFEAKHQFLKQRMQGNNNYRNVVKSLTERCLMYETSLNICESHSLVSNNIVIGKSRNITHLKNCKTQINAFFAIPVNEIYSVYETNWIKYYGQKFLKEECVIVFGEDNGIPEFGLLKDIWIVEEKRNNSQCQQIYLSLSMYETVNYDEHLLAYQVTDPTLAQGLELVRIENIFLHIPLHLYLSSDRQKYVFSGFDMVDLVRKKIGSCMEHSRSS